MGCYVKVAKGTAAYCAEVDPACLSQLYPRPSPLILRLKWSERVTKKVFTEVRGFETCDDDAK